MKVRILISIAGNAEPMYDLPDFSFAPGETLDLHDTLAQHWINAGHAESVQELSKKGRKAAAAAAPELLAIVEGQE